MFQAQPPFWKYFDYSVAPSFSFLERVGTQDLNLFPLPRLAPMQSKYFVEIEFTECVSTSVARFGPKAGQIGQKWNKFEISQISSGSQMVLKSDLMKKSQICPIWGQSDPLWD